MLYNKKIWYKNWSIAFLLYIRDFVVNLLPVRRLPSSLRRFLYGFDSDFIFLVHPRRSQDFFIALPFLSFIRKFLIKKKFVRLLGLFPPFVISRIKTSKGVNGLIVSSLLLPDELLNDRKKSLKEAKRMIDFSVKISRRNCNVGLGAWWPIVTKRGEYFNKFISEKDVFITTGHTVTSISILISIRRMLFLSNIAIKDLRIIILGAGRMGSQIVEMLALQGVINISLYDINEKRLKFVKSRLKEKFPKVNIQIFSAMLKSDERKEVLKEHHLGVCVTSSINRVLMPEDIPQNFIILDDARPEGINRNLGDDSKVVLEGGLVDFSGLESDYDFGFGKSCTIFGCLAEAIILSIDHAKVLKPTTGSVDMSNLSNFLLFMKESGLDNCVFKSGAKIFSDDEIKKILLLRGQYIKDRNININSHLSFQLT